MSNVFLITIVKDNNLNKCVYTTVKNAMYNDHLQSVIKNNYIFENLANVKKTNLIIVCFTVHNCIKITLRKIIVCGCLTQHLSIEQKYNKASGADRLAPDGGVLVWFTIWDVCTVPASTRPCHGQTVTLHGLCRESSFVIVVAKLNIFPGYRFS